jgi:hypothetical protein
MRGRDDCVNDFQFTSSLVASLAWPVVVIVLAIIFRTHIAHLLGRIKSYKGMGQEVTFGHELANAENSVLEAVRSAATGSSKPDQIDAIEPSPLARKADANPSFVVIHAWEQVARAVLYLADVGPPAESFPAQPISTGLLNELQKLHLVNSDFTTAVLELRELRNQVAHGEHNPTAGEAVAYAESAQVLAATARMMADFAVHNRELLSRPYNCKLPGLSGRRARSHHRRRLARRSAPQARHPGRGQIGRSAA